MCKLLAIFAAIFRKKAPLPALAEKGEYLKKNIFPQSVPEKYAKGQ